VKLLWIIPIFASFLFQMGYNTIALAQEPKVKVHIFFNPGQGTALKLVKPGSGVSFMEDGDEISARNSETDFETNSNYCEDESLSSPPTPEKPSDTKTNHKADTSCK
jgi:hypothetical protein